MFDLRGSGARASLAALGMVSAIACAGKSADDDASGQQGPDGDSPAADRDSSQLQSSSALPACADALQMTGYTKLALYRFEEAQGTQLLDDSGFAAGNEAYRQQGGTLMAGRRSEGRCGRGVTFDTDGAHLELGPMGEGHLDPGLALSLWLRPASISEGEAHIVGDGGGGLASFQLVLVSGVPVFRLSNPLGEWDEVMRASAPLVA